MARHTLVWESLEAGDGVGSVFEVAGDAAKHAVRVKRVGEGDVVRVLDGRGGYAVCRVVEAWKVLVLEVEERGEMAALRPAVHVYSASPKGQRLDKMLDMLGQAGAASWTPLETKFGVVEPGEGKMARAERIAEETVKQCLRPTAMRIGEMVDVEGALAQARERGDRVVVADGAGEGFAGLGFEGVSVFVGPEGGFVEEEIAAMLGAGGKVVSFGPLVMRIETAAVVGAALVMAGEGAALGLGGGQASG